MTLTEDNLLPLSGLQHLFFLQTPVLFDKYRTNWAGIMRERKTLEIENRCSEGDLLL